MSQWFTSVLEEYKLSIINFKHADYSDKFLPVGCASSPVMLIYNISMPQPSRGLRCYPSIRSRSDWGSLEVAEHRELEIEKLLNSSYLRLRPGPASTDFSWPRLDASGKLKMRAMLKKALYTADAIHDIEAKVSIEMDIPTRRALDKSSSFPGESPLTRNEAVAIATRQQQVSFIKDLETPDLVDLFMLCTLASASWIERSQGSHEFSVLEIEGLETVSLSRWLRYISFREAILRYGSWYLYAEVRGFGSRARHHRRLRQSTQADVVEADPDSRLRREKTLFATVNSELAERIGEPVPAIDLKIFDMVEKRIGAMKPGAVFQRGQRPGYTA